MKSKYYLFLAAAISLISCKKEVDETTTADPRLLVPFTQQSLGGTQPTQQAPQQHNLFNKNKTEATTSVANAVNPPHGQPGHVCGNDSGTTTQSSSPQVQTTMQPTMQPTVTKTKTITPKGMNPPHGEPGHVCGTAVGAPLNSKTNTTKVATTTPAVTSGEVSKEISVGTPVPNLLAAPTVTPEGMNPPHGQPGHVCGTTVGAPLPKN